MKDGLILILCVIFWILGHNAIAMWLLALYALKDDIEGGELVVYYLTFEDYPQKDLIVPKKFKFFYKEFEKVTYTYKGIPKEIYYAKIVRFIAFWIFTLVGIVAMIIDPILAGKIMYCYVVIVLGIGAFVTRIIIQRKSFLSRFKKLNLYNFIYFSGFFEDMPYPRMKGKCKIVSECPKGKKIYVTVCMLETGELKEKVLRPGNKRQGENPTYSLYEICRVLYIL